MIIAQILLALLAIGIGFYFLKQNQSSEVRLENLFEHEEFDSEEIEWSSIRGILDPLKTKEGQAGFLDVEQQKKYRLFKFAGGMFSVTAAILAIPLIGMPPIFSITLVFVFLFIFLSSLDDLFKRRFEKKLYFQTPLLLENVILLVGAGLGILPALAQILEKKEEEQGPAEKLLGIVYKLVEQGLPFSAALELVADSIDNKLFRHILLHLDVSSTEGGELMPSLKSLSDHAYTHWKLSVEGRIKKLENLVVFPVFTAVIGLVILIGAAPLVPVLELKSQLSSTNAMSGNFSQGVR